MKKLAILICGAMVAVSCSTTATALSKKQVSVEGTHWVLADTVRGNQPTLTIETNRVSGDSGCNNYFGELVLDATAGNFSVKNIGSTRKACDNQSVEANFLTMLREADKYTATETTLELYKGGLLLMKFNKK
ncbi:MAG: META domain-containing protein [Bergeyella zoohelcum]|nr:META domain-containing protein [Bergeyella zoohelcum]